MWKCAGHWWSLFRWIMKLSTRRSHLLRKKSHHGPESLVTFPLDLASAHIPPWASVIVVFSPYVPPGYSEASSTRRSPWCLLSPWPPLSLHEPLPNLLAILLSHFVHSVPWWPLIMHRDSLASIRKWPSMVRSLYAWRLMLKFSLYPSGVSISSSTFLTATSESLNEHAHQEPLAQPREGHLWQLAATPNLLADCPS